MSKRSKKLFRMAGEFASTMLNISILRAGFATILLLVTSCDIRTEQMADGRVVYAPLKNGYGGQFNEPPSCPPVLGCPSRGVISSSASFGSGASTVFDVDRNTLAFIMYGHVGGASAGAPNGPDVAPLPKIVTVTNADRNEIVRFTNYAWAPSGDPPPSAPMVDSFSIVTLIDGKIVKTMDGHSAASKLSAALDKIGERYRLFR